MTPAAFKNCGNWLRFWINEGEYTPTTRTSFPMGGKKAPVCTNVALSVNLAGTLTFSTVLTDPTAFVVTPTFVAEIHLLIRRLREVVDFRDPFVVPGH